MQKYKILKIYQFGKIIFIKFKISFLLLLFNKILKNFYFWVKISDNKKYFLKLVLF